MERYLFRYQSNLSVSVLELLRNFISFWMKVLLVIVEIVRNIFFITFFISSIFSERVFTEADWLFETKQVYIRLLFYKTDP